MAIKITYIIVEGENLATPCVICDVCGKQITDFNQGGYFFPGVGGKFMHGEPGTFTDVLFAHKRCSYAPQFEDMLWQELRYFTHYLAANWLPKGKNKVN